MQKTFIKYTFIIVTTAILLILVIHFLLSLSRLQTQQFDTFYEKTEQMIHTLENNQEELRLLNESLDEDYLTRAKAAAYVLDRQEEISMDVGEMQYLANLLNVDEVHVIDESGIIVASSVSKYIGIDMANHDQTRPFLSLLDGGEKDACLIQEVRPNAAEGKIRQYVGVARKEKRGVIQVGFKPTRQMQAQSRNTYDYIFSRFPTNIGEELFVVDASTGEMLGHSGGLPENCSADCYRLDQLLGCTGGAYRAGPDGQSMYVVSRPYDRVLLCAALPKRILMETLWHDALTTLCYLLFIEATVILLLNYLVQKTVIRGIHEMIENLEAITNGRLDTTISIHGNREFEELSRGINTMLKSIIHLTDRFSAIIENSGFPLAAFEYDRGLSHVFLTPGLSELLYLSDQKAEELSRDAALFDRYIRGLTASPIEGEEEIFEIYDDRYVHIHMSETAEGCLGIISDVTREVLQKKQMHYENTHDHLTDLYKFSHFKQLAAETLSAMPGDRMCAVVMLDLDAFKSINDTYGHDFGDKYLQSFASVLKAMPEDHFIPARRSGDEFCMMIYDCTDKAEVLSRLEFFFVTLSQNEIAVSETESRAIRASGGFVCTVCADDDIAVLLSYADEALYRVKRDSKGGYAEYGEP